MNPALVAILERFEDDLDHVADSHLVVETFANEVDRVTRGVDFHIHNETIWQIMLAARDMAVIRLSGWAEALFERGGLLGQLQSNSQAFPRERTFDEKVSKDVHRRQALARGHSDAFKRLFSCSCEPVPTTAAFKALGERLDTELGPVIRDRNNFRAHPYGKQRSSSARMLDLPELRNAITFSKRFMNDVRLVMLGGTRLYADHPPVDIVNDLVDMVILNPSQRARRNDEERDRFYADLHIQRERLPPGGIFNALDLD